MRKLFGEAEAAGKITPALIAANTNLTAAIAQLVARSVHVKKGAEGLMPSAPANAPSSSKTAVAAQSKLAPPADPMEVLLLATFPISDGDLETLAADRAKAVRAYILQSGKVEDTRLFLTESQTGGVRADGSRVYLQFQ